MFRNEIEVLHGFLIPKLIAGSAFVSSLVLSCQIKFLARARTHEYAR